MRKVIAIFLLALFSCFTAQADVAHQKPLEIGVVPYLSARIIISSYEPMRRYLEQVLGTPVKIYTANGFKQFLLNAQHGDYDVAVSPAHFARILQKDNKFDPMVRYSKGGRGLVMVNKTGPINELSELKGKKVAVPFRLSLASIICVTALEENGLHDGKEITLVEYPSFESALLAVKNGEVTAAVSAPGALAQVNQQLRESVKPVLDTGEYINLIYLAHSRMGDKQSSLVNNALVKFGNTEEGKKFFASTGFGEFLPATHKDMDSVEKYVRNTKILLEQEK